MGILILHKLGLFLKEYCQLSDYAIKVQFETQTDQWKCWDKSQEIFEFIKYVKKVIEKFCIEIWKYTLK